MAARMPSKRRTGDESSEMRAKLLETAERIMIEDGYAAVSTRRIAQELGVTGQLVYYYFRDMDELFLALVERGSERRMAMVEKVLAAADPVRALWDAYDEPAAARRVFEYMALSNHRKDVARVSLQDARRIRRLETAALSRTLNERGVDSKRYPTAGVAMVMAAVARIMGMEKAVGMTEGHAEAHLVMQEFLQSMGGTAPVEPATSSGARPAKPVGVRQSRSRR